MYEYYENPLCTRYASEEMKRIFSRERKVRTWRRLWLLLAENEQALGLPITDEQLDELRAHLDDADMDAAAEYERRVRHDVMAELLAFGDQCPKARPILHLGATSCYVGDNADILNLRDAMDLIRDRLLNAIEALSVLAERYEATPALAYTHFQAAQPTTVGKRICLWISDLLFDLRQLDFQREELRPLGCKGTTGTGASFLALFDGDGEKAERLDQRIAEGLGFPRSVSVSGQTYSRKTDYAVVQVLSGIAQSTSKFAGDLRLLCHEKELDEPAEPGQIGSSAMAYKRNPMRSERISSLARYVICLSQNTAVTAASQWLERSLDDSANRRLTLPEAFLATDAVLCLSINVARGLLVYPKVCERHLQEELPFMATENILMYCVKTKGLDRQTLHERLRVHAREAAEQVKLYGRENDLLQRIREDDAFALSETELQTLLDPGAFTGLAQQQCRRFLQEEIHPLLEANRDRLGMGVEINV
ncbi:MAG: adenylosuccinate lyase [Oscillospiraceae bacterium]|nr:adenylosuccinate lyase [Oscillospiraceae bacterium]